MAGKKRGSQGGRGKKKGLSGRERGRGDGDARPTPRGPARPAPKTPKKRNTAMHKHMRGGWGGGGGGGRGGGVAERWGARG